MIMKRTILILSLVLACNLSYGQSIPLPTKLSQGHPRLMTTQENKPSLEKLIKDEAWAGEVFRGILDRIDPYVERTQAEPDWLYSRLMMYWTSRATDVFINGGEYSHSSGTAPVPTVRFGSTRGVSSPYKRPSLEDVIPYMDDTKGVYFRNTAKKGSPLEWTEQKNASGGSIESVNSDILRIGRDAAFVYWLTGKDRYAKFAYDIFDTYMTGMYYRNEPVDLGNGHANTLAGLSTFEVIQESILSDLAAYYDFLHAYIKEHHGDKAAIFECAFKKWIGLTIKNGVPHNNWNLHQANIILSVAMVLEDDENYRDGKGRQFYIDHILNKSTPRQWSIPKLMQYGYDPATGIWNECPGYAQSVTKEFMHFINSFDNTFGHNLLPYTPVMYRAVEVLPQYLFPNNQTSAFGDSYYAALGTQSIKDMIHLSRKYGDRENEVLFTKIYKLFESGAEQGVAAVHKPAPQVSSLFMGRLLTMDETIEKGKPGDYITPTFYAPNVSWFVQRAKYDDQRNGLMISQYASYGNHAHSNGIAMELYGKGFVLGAESGIGSSYFEKPYLEYYSQFPAHNTVMVDGISKYPEMLSNHPFELLGCYPEPDRKESCYTSITYSEVYFLEPESRSDQNRLLSIVSTGETTGYYVDIFRSKKQRGGDKYHEYFYHNLGQELFIRDLKGEPLDLHPSEDMAFAGGHLFALDYMWDKNSVKPNDDYQAVWKMSMPDGDHVYMNLWMKGCEGREVFSIKAPPCKAFRSNDGFPYEVSKEPYLTIAARQHGEAWNRPFVSIYEPSTENEGRSIEYIRSFDAYNKRNISPDFIGIAVKSKSGRTDYLFSSVKDEKVSYDNMVVNATYAVISENGRDFTLFLGDGTLVSAKGFTIEAGEKTNAVLEYKNGRYSFTCDKPVTIKTPKGKKIKTGITSFRVIEF